MGRIEGVALEEANISIYARENVIREYHVNLSSCVSIIQMPSIIVASSCHWACGWCCAYWMCQLWSCSCCWWDIKPLSTQWHYIFDYSFATTKHITKWFQHNQTAWIRASQYHSIATHPVRCSSDQPSPQPHHPQGDKYVFRPFEYCVLKRLCIVWISQSQLNPTNQRSGPGNVVELYNVLIWLQFACLLHNKYIIACRALSQSGIDFIGV